VLRWDEVEERNEDGGAPDARPLFWPAWLWPLLAWVPLAEWHERFAREIPRLYAVVLAGTRVAPGTLAWAATAFVVALALAEALLYGMLWRARGRRLPVAAAAVAVLQAGLLELAALRLLDALPAEAPAWAAALAGARALRPAGPLATAFGGAGLLALLRVALFAGLQAGLARASWREAFALTCAGWLASHVAWWWLIELAQGRSVFR